MCKGMTNKLSGQVNDEAKKIPSYLCSDCAEGFPEKFRPLGYGYTISQGICPICSKEKGLAHANDYGIAGNKYDFD